MVLVRSGINPVTRARYSGTLPTKLTCPITVNLISTHSKEIFTTLEYNFREKFPNNKYKGKKKDFSKLKMYNTKQFLSHPRQIFFNL